MAISRTARIKILLVIDVLFFFVELIVGYAVGSLALVADSFHMLNDVMSLVVALYAIKLTSENIADSRYSYGWHRAEILAALVNGVFLLALCFSIFLEAMERFFSTPEIANPKLVVIVGSFGLASNIIGLFLFHEHSHSHSHSHTIPEVSITPSSPALTPGSITPTQEIPRRSSELSRASTESRRRSESLSGLYGHPAVTRAFFVQTAEEIASAQSPPPSATHSRHNSTTQLLDTDQPNVAPASPPPETIDESARLLDGDEVVFDEEESENVHVHGHSHSGSMNMRAILLHVLGDALGNVGVIATGLIIWLTTWPFKYYFDPIISLIITMIIFSSALPLVRSASFILLQAVPSTVSLEAVRTSILDVDGVLSVHELHIWQLSETKIVASVHVMASRKHDFMPVAAEIRKVLHHHGIHSSTIQPEYTRLSRAEESLMTSEDASCLLPCPKDQACNPQENSCCPPPPNDV